MMVAGAGLTSTSSFITTAPLWLLGIFLVPTTAFMYSAILMISTWYVATVSWPFINVKVSLSLIGNICPDLEAVSFTSAN